MVIGLENNKNDLLPYRNICMVLFAALLLLDLDFFGLIPTHIYSSYNKGLDRTGEIILLSLLVFFKYRQKSKLSIKQLFYWNHYLVYMFYVIFTCGVASIIRYNESFVDIYVMVNFYLLLALIYPLMDDLNDRGNYIVVFWIINIINLCLLVLQSFVFNITGILFMQKLIYENLSMRNGLIRFGNVSFLPILIICAYGECSLIKTRLPKWVFYLAIPLGIYAVLFVGMIRGMIFPLFLTLFIMFLLKKSKPGYKAITALLLVITLPFIIKNSQVQFYINSIFSKDPLYSIEYHNFSIRIENILYRINYFFDNPLFGMGIIRAINSHLKTILQGPNWLYFPDDVGNFDLISSFGLFGLISWTAIVFRWINILKKHHKFQTLSKNVWLIGLIIYYFLSGFTLGYFVPERIISFCVIICLLEKSLDQHEMALSESKVIQKNYGVNVYGK